jgi:hypothetical protein
MTQSDKDVAARLRKEMNKLADNLMGREDGMVKVAHPSSEMSNTSYRAYRSSFLTLSDFQIPDDYRDIFRWCRYFFKFDSLVGPAVRALATFPITDWVLNDSEEAEDSEELEMDERSDLFEFYDQQLDDLKLHKHLIEIGYDYYLYGNCIIFAEPGVKTVDYRDDDSGEIKQRQELVWKNVERLDVTRVRIDKDPKTKEKIYYYDVPPELKAIIQKKSPKEKYDKIPNVFKKAVEKKGLVKLNSKYIYHLAMPSESGDSGLWATPPTLHALKLILYTNVLRQAQEAIAYEHIVPRRIYFFNETKNFAPEFNFSQIADDFAFELQKQLNDPNYQVISPIPIQQIQHGGQGRTLLLVPEIEQLQNTILAAMGVPREFVFGGVSYSGSTTSLRILENNFMTYRNLLLDYINEFLIKGLAKLRGDWEALGDDKKLPYIEFTELKMQDDIQQKQLMIQLNAQGKLPDEVLYEKVFGLEAKNVKKMLLNEQIEQLENQYELQAKQQELQEKFGPPPEQMGGDPAMQGAPEGAPMQQGEQPPEGGEPQQQEGQGQEQEQGHGGQQGVSDVEAFKIAQQLANATPEEQGAIVRKLGPDMSRRVMMYIQQISEQEKAENGDGVDMSPYPEKLPPRRQGGV